MEILVIIVIASTVFYLVAYDLAKIRNKLEKIEWDLYEIKGKLCGMVEMLIKGKEEK